MRYPDIRVTQGAAGRKIHGESAVADEWVNQQLPQRVSGFRARARQEVAGPCECLVRNLLARNPRGVYIMCPLHRIHHAAATRGQCIAATIKRGRLGQGQSAVPKVHGQSAVGSKAGLSSQWFDF